ncbi:MAG TPA: hypothetical protein VNU46_08305, partial [Gemmatimonadaceae bacterium]|nr:hypothetical protein [Gemmatimonadaceae bacterium]
MIRRARIALVSAVVLFACIGLMIGTAFMVARSAFGRDYVRRLVISLVRRGVHGTVYVGHITGSFLSDVTIDSLAIRDPNDSLFVSTGQVTLHYDIRDILDRRILLRGVRAEHPVVHLRQHENGTWNFQTIFPSSHSTLTTPGRGFGDYVVIDSAVVRSATFVLTLPWHPSPTLHGVA